MFAEKIQEQINYLSQEIKNVQAEIDRVDSFDSYRFDLKKRLLDLNKQLESNKKLLRVFGPKDEIEVEGASAVNL